MIQQLLDYPSLGYSPIGNPKPVKDTAVGQEAEFLLLQAITTISIIVFE